MEKPDTNVPMTPSTPSMPNTSCGADKGTLPCPCAPLAFPYIPMQENNPVRFSRMEALQTGTLFPGLDLPFKAAIQAYIKLGQEGREKYQKMYGPLLQTDLTPEAGYAWLKDPWPWDEGGND